jgi:hypothetical protein
MEYQEYVVDLNADCKCGCMDGNRFHKIFRFPNGYGASVVNSPKKPGYKNEGYNVMVIKFAGDEFRSVNLPILEESDLKCNDWNAAVRTLTKIKDMQV